MDEMRWVFWISVVIVAYTFAGYPLWLRLASSWRKREVHASPALPTISIVMAVRNEAHVLQGKLANLRQSRYPPDRCQIVVVSDGSTDDTNKIVGDLADDHLQPILISEHVGKAEALNRGVSAATGQVVVFTDARQTLEPDALERLVADFGDPTVGCVSGELILRDSDSPETLRGAGLYWQLEKKIREWESASGSVVGATGALYAVRRDLFQPLPPHTILDDVYVPMQVVRQGRRVVFEPKARAWDCPPSTAAAEFRRKVRTLTGNYQLLKIAPWILSHEDAIRFRFVSHKLLRLLVPFALAAALISSVLAGGTFYRAVAASQLLFYASAAIGALPVRLGVVGRMANVTLAFVVLNIAAVVALVNFLIGKEEVWAR
jgi:poly-beta-1,6-N-acetyl-D-glucosamine synthase